MNKLPPLSQAKKVECVIIDKNSIKDGTTVLTKELELTDKHPMFLEFEKLAVIHGKPGEQVSCVLVFEPDDAAKKATPKLADISFLAFVPAFMLVDIAKSVDQMCTQFGDSRGTTIEMSQDDYLKARRMEEN